MIGKTLKYRHLRALLMCSAATFGASAAHAATPIDTNQAFYLQSNVGTTVNPDFQGGTLRDDQNGATDANGYTVENFSTNTIDAFGNQTTFTGNFTGAGPLTITDSVGGGSVIMTGVNSYSGTTTINSGATLALGNGGGSVGLLAGAITDNGLIDFNGGGGSLAIYATGITGSGAVTIQSGTIELTGVNSYSGTTTINAGATLQLGAGSGFGLLAGAITDNGALAFDGGGGALANYITGITGSGTLELKSGTLQLSGNNIYTGSTTIDSGATLAITGTGSIAQSSGVADAGTFDISGASGGVSIVSLSGAGGVTLGNNTLTISNGSASDVYSGTIAGGGGLTVAGGTAVLSGLNTFSGTTQVNGGATLQLGDGAGNMGLLAGAITDNGAIVFNGGGGSLATYATGITGTGTVEVKSGTLGLQGNNTYTGSTTIDATATLQIIGSGSIAQSSGLADAGTFDISGAAGGVSISSLSGAGGVTLGNNTLTISNGNAADIYSGKIAGNGGLTVAGGTAVLSGFNTFAGTTQVNSGATLQLGDGAGNMGLLGGPINDDGLINFNGGGGSLAIYATGITGSGAVTIESGTMELTGVNSYSGTTTIDPGATLQMGAGSGFGLLAGAITDNGALAFDGGGGALATYVTGITGTGTLELKSGTLGLQGDNTYTGSTTIDSGAKLQIIGAGSIANSSGVADAGTFDISGATGGVSIKSLSGAGGVTLGNNTLTISNGNAADIYSGTIAGAGGLTVAGGTAVLSGLNTFAGTTQVNGGATLQLGDGAGNMGLLAGAITDNGAIVFNGGGGSLATYATGITGAGTVELKSGTLGLQGNNTYTGSTTIDASSTLQIIGSGSIANSSGVADAGTFDISSATAGVSVKTLSGAGAADLGGNALTLSNASGTFSGLIADGGSGGGTGGALILASGAETLSGANGYTGGTTIQGGVLTASNSSALGSGPVQVNGPGTLTLTSSLTTGALTDAGTVNIPASKTLTTSSYVASTGTLQLGLTSTGSANTLGTVVSTGNVVNLSGETVKINVTGVAIATGAANAIVLATGNAAETAADAPLKVVGSPFYQFTVAPGTGATADDLLLTATQSAATTANANNANAVVETSYELMDGVLDLLDVRLGAFGASSAGGGQDQAAAGNVETAARGGETGLAAGSLSAGRSAWGQFFGQAAHQSSGAGNVGFSARTGGFAMGADTDTLVHDAVLGAALSYASSYVTANNSTTQSTAIGSYQLSLYGDYDLSNRNFLRGMAAYAFNTDINSRHNVGGTPGLTAEGKYNANEYALELKAGHNYSYGGATLTPGVLARYFGYDGQDYTETGAGGADQHVTQKYLSVLEVGPTVEAAWNFRNDDGSRIVPALHAGYRYDLIGDSVVTTSAFTSGGGAFPTTGARPDRNRFNLGADATLLTAGRWEFRAAYDMDLRQDYVNNSGVVRVTYRF
jgi:autotransporter-associated beta strand protein